MKKFVFVLILFLCLFGLIACYDDDKITPEPDAIYHIEPNEVAETVTPARTTLQYDNYLFQLDNGVLRLFELSGGTIQLRSSVSAENVVDLVPGNDELYVIKQESRKVILDNADELIAWQYSQRKYHNHDWWGTRPKYKTDTGYHFPVVTVTSYRLPAADTSYLFEPLSAYEFYGRYTSSTYGADALYLSSSFARVNNSPEISCKIALEYGASFYAEILPVVWEPIYSTSRDTTALYRISDQTCSGVQLYWNVESVSFENENLYLLCTWSDRFGTTENALLLMQPDLTPAYSYFGAKHDSNIKAEVIFYGQYIYYVIYDSKPTFTTLSIDTLEKLNELQFGRFLNYIYSELKGPYFYAVDLMNAYQIDLSDPSHPILANKWVLPFPLVYKDASAFLCLDELTAIAFISQRLYLFSMEGEGTVLDERNLFNIAIFASRQLTACAADGSIYLLSQPNLVDTRYFYEMTILDHSSNGFEAPTKTLQLHTAQMGNLSVEKLDDLKLSFCYSDGGNYLYIIGAGIAFAYDTQTWQRTDLLEYVLKANA